MALTRLSRSSSPIDPLPQLGRVISELLPHQGLPLIDKVRRWSDRMLVLGALLMCWAAGTSLIDRFNLARACVVELYPTRKRPGRGYNGFIDCLARHSVRLRDTLIAALRERLIGLAGGDYRTHGFVCFGADGTKITVPRSDANLDHFGVANKKHAGPEIMLCGLFHLATRSLWSFAHGVAKSSERALLATMLPCLPKDSLVLADAGFVGWNTVTALLGANQHFVIRAGANVRLLIGLCHTETRGDIVYLWPDKQQNKSMPPVVLRCVRVCDSRGRQMCLLTSVLDANRLSDKQIIGLYAMRWHVEVSYRWLKVSLAGRKMLSTSPEHARVEMDWTMMGLWMLTLIGLARGVRGEQQSLAGTLRVVREAMTRQRQTGRGSVRSRLRHACRDGYRRWRPKSKRHWPKRSRLHRCGTPLARMANAEEIERYQAILHKPA